ncbi:MAG TPA: hypothetical protein ENN23_05420 [Deltaproteobacteria bacterium]|nr:hypothetical protein [Deltaproteobacteria bacterium]
MNIKLIYVAAALAFLCAAAACESKTIVKIGSHATVAENQTVNNVVTIGGQITVNGLVENNVVAIGGSVVVTSKAVVRGNVVAIGGVVATGSGAQIFGKVTEMNSANITASLGSIFRGEPDAWSAALNIFSLYFHAIIFILAIFMSLLFPRTLTALTKSIQNNKIKSFFWGFLISLMIPPILILLVFSIIGIYLLPLAFISLAAAFMLGYIAAAALLGNTTLAAVFSSYKKSPVKETILGLIMLLALGWLPYIGWLIRIVALTMGLGGVMLGMFSHRRQRTAAT